jgi:short subunit dehydrogenase-like uncharacterized protein
MMEGCLAAGADYLDITGEIDVIVSAAERSERAAHEGVALLPAVGFDVVPSDCLAAMLAARARGVSIFRVHDAGAARQALTVFDAVQNQSAKR